MTLSLAKSILYAFCGISCLIFALLTMAGVIFLSGIGMQIPVGRSVLETLCFGVLGVLLLFVAIRRLKPLSIPTRPKYLSLVTAIAIAMQLATDLIDQAQGFHLGHVFFGLAMAGLIHDAILAHGRGNAPHLNRRP